ncbi:L-lactate MFS transporter [Butyrivibrio sp. AD3002]|uniref:L-lactate MFS transporter n=1 Tax=Butyrivibrio sp. AD3002 TaxID=1280670 RepID=UPI0003B320FB|nr:OFA family MFS transporter [Butyrivibrio sp. AD3002]
MNLTSRRWLVLIASCLINLCIGALYAWSVFASPMAEHISAVQGLSGDNAVTASSLAIVFSIANVVGPITMIGGGKLVRTIGPRFVIMIGGIWFGLGFLICGFAGSVPGLIFGFGICCGLAMGMTYGCTVSNCVKFFPDKRGLVGGIATASYGLSSVLVPIIANAIISKMDVTMAFKILGIAIVIIVFAASLLILPCPDGFVPEGYVAPLSDNTKASKAKDYTWSEMLKTKEFYVMMVLMCCGAFMGMMIISQASPIAQNQVLMSSQAAAVVVSVLALFNTGGRILGGFISDLIGQINTLTILLFCSIVGLFMLIITGEGSAFTLYAGICIIGICFGGFMGIYPGFTNEKFGAKYSSVNYGIMFIGFAFSGFFAPIIIGRIYSMQGTYVAAYYAAMILSILGIALTFIYRIMNK